MAVLGDRIHLLSGECPALQPTLKLAMVRGLSMLQHNAELHEIAQAALRKSPLDIAKFLADPTTEPEAIAYKQKHGSKSIFPLLRFSRSYIWAMHRQHMRLKGVQPYQ